MMTRSTTRALLPPTLSPSTSNMNAISLSCSVTNTSGPSPSASTSQKRVAASPSSSRLSKKPRKVRRIRCFFSTSSSPAPRSPIQVEPTGSTTAPRPTRYHFYSSSVRQAEEALSLSRLPSSTSLSSSLSIQEPPLAASTSLPVATRRYKFYFSSLLQVEETAIASPPHPIEDFSAGSPPPPTLEDAPALPPTDIPVEPAPALLPSAMPTRVDFLPELLSEIAMYLRTKDLVHASEVSWDWRAEMMPFVWTSITHHKWRCPQFRRLGSLVRQAKFDELRALLRRVVEVEWGNDDDSGLSYSEIVVILRSMPNLKKLSLTTTGLAKRVLLNLLKDPRELLTLGHLQLDLIGFEAEAEAENEEDGEIDESEEEGELQEVEEGEPVPLNDLFSRFDQLEGLGLAGWWYAPYHHQAAIVEVAGQAQQEEAVQPQWAIKNLRIPRSELGILRHCPHLRKLVLTAKPTDIQETALEPILGCRQLEELVFEGPLSFRISDMVNMHDRLDFLTAVSITLESVSEFDRLWALQFRTFAPHLRSFKLEVQREFDGQENALTWQNTLRLNAILFWHREVRTLILKGFAVQPRDFFREVEEGGVTSYSNPAPQVEELWIEIHIDPFFITTNQDRHRIWQATYDQLSQMRYLRSLTVKSPDLDHTFMAGFGRLSQLTHLRHLGISAGGQAWTFDGLYRVVEVLPWLTSLDLQDLQDIDKADTHRWLAELGRPDLRL
ncbi:hypothetical protein KI688_011321 [Linnemannia hyalina]|uniref:F-box domain-containing protein n=1 Tax=Linnemannia hyalina TaxID=64524 RepID=A0A9P8BT08_9FUNG|nr:hypothetical protein KI688_011321 [Linnemannia hyalina]